MRWVPNVQWYWTWKRFPSSQTHSKCWASMNSDLNGVLWATCDGMGALLKSVISRLTSIMHHLLSISHRMNKNVFHRLILYLFGGGGCLNSATHTYEVCNLSSLKMKELLFVFFLSSRSRNIFQCLLMVWRAQ